MPVSSGTKSLFSTLLACLAVAGATAYGLKHRAEVKQAVAHLSGDLLAKRSTKTHAAEQPAANDASSEAAAPGDDDGVVLKANNSGHFKTDAEINGRTVEVMVDTGATMVALTYEDAERAGIFLRPSDFTGTATTANGVSKIAPVKISEITIGGITVRNVDGAVAELGKMQGTLLGMSFLGRLSRVDMRSRALVLHQ